MDQYLPAKPYITNAHIPRVSIIKLRKTRDSCIVFNDTNIFISKCLEISTIYDRVEIQTLKNSSGKIVFSTESTLNSDTTLLIACFEPPAKCNLFFIDDKLKQFRRIVELLLFEHPVDTAALLSTDLLTLNRNTSFETQTFDVIYFYTSKENKGFRTRFRRLRLFFDENLNFSKSVFVSQSDEFRTHRVENVLAFGLDGFAYFLRVVAHRETNSWLLVAALERICLHYRAAWNESSAGIHAPLLLLKPERTEFGPKLLTSQNPVAANFDPETDVLQIFVGDYDDGKLIYSMRIYDMQDVHRQINRHRIRVSSTKFKYFINCYNNSSNTFDELPLSKQFTDKYTTVDGVDLCSMSNCRLASQLEYKLVEPGRVSTGISMNSERDGTFYGEIDHIINVDHKMMLVETKNNYLLVVVRSDSSESVFHNALIRSIGNQSFYRSVFANDTVIIVDGAETKNIPVNCSMQDTCSETVWLKNLRNRFADCGWCYSSTGQSFGSTPEICSLSNRSTFLTSHCPPEINCFENDYIDVENSTLVTLNGFFPKDDNQRIDVCGSPCNALLSTESRVTCRTKTPVHSENTLKSSHCPITLETLFLNDTYRTSPRCAKKLRLAEAFSTNYSNHRLLFVAIFVSVAILIPIVSSVCGLCRNLSTNKKKKSNADWESLSQGEPLVCRILACMPRYSVASESDAGVRYAKNMMVNDDLCYLVPNSIRIPWNAVVKKNLIGMGHFGKVYKGAYTRPDGTMITVAIKTLIIGTGNVQQFLDEGVRMKFFDHKNVLSLVGLTFDEFNQPLIITPFMTHGDLLSFLRCTENSPTVGRLLTFGLEIAEGLEYLHHLRFVHRDLAARNCMLDDELCVKVADFGLSRDVYETEYYRSTDPEADVPVKWLPIESIELREYSSKSDVWSFGITLWELMTRGLTPYPNLTGYRLLKYIKSGRRLPRPDICHEDIYELMKMCWHEKPADRPDSTCVVVRFKAVMNMLITDAPSYSNMKSTVECSSRFQEELSSIGTLDIKDCDLN